MKKLLSIFILAAMLVSLTACGNNDGGTVPTTTTAAAKADISATEQEPEETASATTTAITSAASTTDETKPLRETTEAPETADTTEISEQDAAETETLSDEAHVPSKNSVKVTIREGDVISADKKRITLDYQYIGGGADSEICFGGEYSLERLDGEEWKSVEFVENAGFNSLGYIIGADSIYNSTEVYLGADFYKEPLTVGKYRVVKPFADGIVYYLEFELTEAKLDSDYPVEEEEGTITLQISSISDGEFSCYLPWASPSVFTVVLGDLNVGDKFCVGDMIEVGYKPMYRLSDSEFRVIATSVDTSTFQLDENAAYKPVIYLYPTETTDVDVKLDYNGELTVTYPEYGGGWTVTANPDGTLFDENGDEYSYLFWEGKGEADYDFSKGFCVKGGDTAEFLREKLEALGLTPREYNEFIVFWLPLMKDNPYNIISFQTERYTDNAVLNVSPQPDTVIRVFMAYKPTESFTEIEPQTLTAPERIGFTLVEWGGTEVR